jgi:hypothetical protein
MKRHLLNLLTVASLLLCAATVLLMVVGSISPRSGVVTRDRPLAGEMPRGPVHYQVRYDAEGASITAIQGRRMEQPFQWLVGPGRVLHLGEWLPSTPSSGLNLGFVSVTSGVGNELMGYNFVGPVVEHPPFRCVTISFPLLAFLALLLPGLRGTVRLRRWIEEDDLRRSRAGT